MALPQFFAEMFLIMLLVFSLLYDCEVQLGQSLLLVRPVVLKFLTELFLKRLKLNLLLLASLTIQFLLGNLLIVH